MKSEVVVTENQLSPDVIEAIQDGRKIEAIKILRENTGIGLANAKVLVDRAWRTHGPKPQKNPAAIQEEAQLSQLARTGLLVVALVGLYFVYFRG